MSIVRRRPAVSVVFVTWWVLGLPMLAAAPAPTRAATRGVQGVALTVADSDRAAAFYAKVLFFEKVSAVERPGPNSRVRVARMQLGDEMLELIEDPAADRSPQRLAIVVNDLEQADLWLRRHHVRPVSPPPRPDWNPETGGIRTIHFNDADGHPLALVQFPADLGAGRWRRLTDRIFLGIDHSASVDAEL